ncbi:helix-turn-helix domain-containing protein [Streptomyces sp. NPDC090109]|uniref:helix-turn-helix domain-containing protein n=1 Tax=Streptomyces sp. NPDC090109 TaxID=3365948 RepID=UPI003802309D
MTTPAREATPAQEAIQLYKLLEPDLMARLMKRTGTGAPVSIRQLAEKSGVPRSTIGNLLTGEQECVLEPSAVALCNVIGVDWPILFAAVGRATRHTSRPRIAVAS